MYALVSVAGCEMLAEDFRRMEMGIFRGHEDVMRISGRGREDVNARLWEGCKCEAAKPCILAGRRHINEYVYII